MSNTATPAYDPSLVEDQMTKTMLLDDGPIDQPLYAHLESVVDYLLSTGNRLAHSFRWGSNRDGYFCHLTLPID